MLPREQVAETVLFGCFEVNLATGEVFKNGRKVRLSGQPAQVLVILLQHAGHLVTREELHELLWHEETFVDFDHGLNNCINRIREVLGDSAASPEWIETLPKRGYRFIAPIRHAEQILENKEAHSPPSPDGVRRIPPGESVPVEPAPVAPFWTRGKRWFAAMSLIAIALSAAIGFTAFSKRSKRVIGSEKFQAVAVLPLANLSGDSSQEYVTDGFTDELITALAKDTSIPVISRTSVMRYKNWQKPLPIVARELGVDALVESSLQRTGNSFKVNTHLIAASTDTQVWAGSYKGDLNEVPQMVARIASDIGALLGPAADKPGRPWVPAVSADAYDEYLKGQFLWNAWQAQAALRHFERAAELDPQFAAAYAGIAKSYCHLEYEQVLPASAAFPQASAATEKALTLDPHNADAHAAQSYLYAQRDWDWNRAELELKTAIAEDPGNSIGHRWYRYILHEKGRTEEALEQARLALKTDPASVTLIKIYAFELARDKHYTEAISTFKEALDFDPNDAAVHFGLADSYDKTGNLDLAALELEKGYRLSGETEVADQFHKDLKRFGYQRGAEAARRFNLERQVRELKRKSAHGNYLSPSAYVYVYADLHDKENTLKWLEAAYGADAHVMVELRDEKFDFVRHEPRFQKIWDNVPFSH